MRIAFFTDTEAIGGAERHLADLAAGVAESGHETMVIAPQDELLDFVRATSARVETRRAGGRRHHGTGGGRRAAALAQALPSLVDAFRAGRAAVVHVNNGGYPGSDLCRIAPSAGRLAGIRHALMTVNSMPWSRGGSIVQAVADEIVWRAVSQVVVPSQRVGDELVRVRRLPLRLLRHLRYGVRQPADELSGPELRARLLGDGSLLAGMVSARPVPEKGYDVFVDALAAAGDSVRGVIVGPVPAGLERRLADRGASSRVTLTGPLSAVGAYHHAIDVLVMPSVTEEAMPLVILEAMAAEKPVLASRLAGTPEAVVDGETGVLFGPGRIDTLAGLLRSADPAELARMGQAGHLRWRQLFSPEALIRSHIQLYEELTRRTVRR